MTRPAAARVFRWSVLIGVVVGLAPITWMREPLPAPNDAQTLVVTALAISPRSIGEAKVSGAWELTSPNSRFGSYSALFIDQDDRLFAVSDVGQLLQFPKPGAQGAVRMTTFTGLTGQSKIRTDVESLTRNPESGEIWVGFEGINMIERFSATFADSHRVQPPQMAGWSSNSGPEAMVRLSDGRFVILAEDTPDRGEIGFPGLLYPGDPVSGAEAVEFTFTAPDGYHPVDMVQIPDGRVLILVRRFNIGLPFTFTSKIIVADPANIQLGTVWSGDSIAEIAAPLPSDNMEGLAVESGDDGTLILWVISDDNALTLQRTLLLRLLWDPVQKPVPPQLSAAAAHSVEKAEQ